MPVLMKTTLLALLITAAAVGCGDSNDSIDMAVNNDMKVPADLGVRDMSMVACTMIGAWPGVSPSGFYDPDYNGNGPATVVVSRQAAGSPWNELSVEAWHADTYPATTMFKSSDTYGMCDNCVLYGTDCDNMGCTDYYFAQGGSGTITRADENLAGRMQASASNLKLVEWDFMNDAPVAGARCVQIASASWDVTWNDVDGGAHD